MTLPPTCPRCLHRDCLCAAIPTIQTRTHVVILRHYSEENRSSNTGRLAHFALPNSTLVDHGKQGQPTVIPPLDGAWLVFPAGEATVVAPTPPPSQIIVLDATWSQARKMFHKIAALRGIPLLRLALVGGGPRLRAAPSPDRVSTIEAIAGALRLLEGDGPAAQLDEMFRVAVDRAAASGRRVARSPTLSGS